MKKSLTISATATALIAAIALAGCSAGSGGAAGSSPAGSGPASPSPAPAGTSANHNGFDTLFAQGMIPHHRQAVEMSEMMLGKQGIDARVTALATKIKAAQGPEIDTMTGWLQAWNEPNQMAGGHAMSGMMGEDDLARLRAAQGAEAARLFLTQMIAHHEGAVEMANAEVRSGRDAAAVRLARGIAAAQTAEIAEMKSLLAAL